jgi:hypothetical protein
MCIRRWVNVDSKRDIILSGSRISSNTHGTGQGGKINITTERNFLLNKSIISALAADHSSGDAGDISVHSKGVIKISNDSVISSDTFGSGAAGDIDIHANRLSITKHSFIESGSIGASSSGQTGKINITANDIVLNHGQINIINEAILNESVVNTIKPGTLNLSAKDISLTHSTVSSRANNSNVASGNIDIRFTHWLIQDDATIESFTKSGNGGSITIHGGELFNMRNSDLITTVNKGGGNGGDIAVKANILLMDTGLIEANAASGNGGKIYLNINAFIPSGDTYLIGRTKNNWEPFSPTLNLIQAVSDTGVTGVPNITSPQLNLSGILANIGGPKFDTSAISQDYCGLGSGSTLTRKGKGGLLPKGDDLLF